MAMSYLKSLVFRLFASTPASNPGSVTEVPPEPSEGRLHLEKDNSDILILPDGRKLGYAQFGSLAGRPIFYLHGLPGARLEASNLDDIALDLGARIIAADRPGMGLSSPHLGRTLLDHPKDLECLAEHLGLQEYGVVGVSGGGPNALACAMTMPAQRLKCVSIVCGLGPPDIGMSGANWWFWIGFTLGWRYFPGISGWFFQRQGRFHLSDQRRLELMLQDLEAARVSGKGQKKDIEVMEEREIARRYIISSRQMFRQGYTGLSEDGHLISTDFGFRIEDIRADLPVRLWYGKQDICVPPNHGEQIARRLGARAHLRLEDETHASIFFNRRREVLSDLLQHMDGPAHDG